MKKFFLKRNHIVEVGQRLLLGLYMEYSTDTHFSNLVKTAGYLTASVAAAIVLRAFKVKAVRGLRGAAVEMHS